MGDVRISLGRRNGTDVHGGLGASGIGNRRDQVSWEKILIETTGIGGAF